MKAKINKITADSLEANQGAIKILGWLWDIASVHDQARHGRGWLGALIELAMMNS